jgi:hypothetical protein
MQIVTVVIITTCVMQRFRCGGFHFQETVEDEPNHTD